MRRRFLSHIPLLALLTACEIERVAIDRPQARLAMHGVLSASAFTQVVLLERTRNGSVSMLAPSFEAGDPIGSDQGIAESGAIVALTTPAGVTLSAIEDNLARIDGKGAGNYRFYLAGSSLQAGGSYRLIVHTKQGELLSAETVIPGGAVADVAEQVVLNRSRDTLFLEWPAAPGASSYFVRIETPFGPRSFFTDSTHLRLTGELRNTEVGVLPRVFIPGFPQAVTVSAVDSNYYDWYRSHNNTLTGVGLVSRVNGGLGFLGSLVRLRYKVVHVVAPQTEPAAGNFRVVGTPLEVGTTPYVKLELYLESASSRSDQSDAISGRYQKRSTMSDPGCPVCGVLGSVQNGKVQLAFLSDWSARDTSDVLTGEIHGDTLVGSYRGHGGIVRFVKQ